MQKIFVLLFCLFMSGQSHAETYQVFLGVAPGGPADIMIRKIVIELEKRTKDQFVVLNRPGSEFVVAYQAFLNETQRNRNVIFVSNAGFYVSAQSEYAHLNLNPFTDLKSLISLISFDMLVIAKKGSAIKDVKDLRGKINIGYVGTTTKLLAEKLNLDPDINLVAYKSDPAVIMAVLGDEVPVGTTLDISPIYQQYKHSFQLVGDSRKLLGISSAIGLSVSHRMPETQLSELNRNINQVLNDPEFVDWFMKTYHKRPTGGSPQEFDRTINDFYRRISNSSAKK